MEKHKPVISNRQKLSEYNDKLLYERIGFSEYPNDPNDLTGGRYIGFEGNSGVKRGKQGLKDKEKRNQ